MEFIIHTYGSYDELVYAINLIKGMIRSTDYYRFLAITVFLSIFIGAGFVALNALHKGGKVSYNWSFNVLLGFVFVFALIKPGAVVVIEDRYYDKSSTAGYFTVIKDVPFGAAIMIWFYSYTQSTLTEMINTYGHPIVSFEDGGMDVSYKLITGMGGIMQSASNVAPELLLNFRHYINDCVMVGVAQEQININELTQPKTANLWDNMKMDSVGDVVVTTYDGAVRPCNSAHAAIDAEFNAKFLTIAGDYCTQNGIDSTACEKKLGAITGGYFNKTARDYILTYLSSATTKNIAENYLDLADKQTNIANATAAIQAEKWLPKLRANTFVVVVLLAPIVFLLVFFAPGAVVKWYGGMYIWLILWGAVDQMMFVMYQKEVYDIFKGMRNSGLGMLQILDVKHEMLEAMGLYGKMRWVSMTLSLAMCMGILKLGNYAMTSIADSMGSAAQSSAGASAQALSGVGGTDAARDSYARQQARGWAASVTPDEAIANQEIINYSQGISAALAQRAHLGGSSHHAGTFQGYISGTKSAGDTMNIEQQIAAAGGSEQYVNTLARKGEYEMTEMIARYDTLKELFNSDHEAAIALGHMAAVKNLIDVKELNAMKDLYGGDAKELADAKAMLATYNFLSAQGGMDMAEAKAEAFGMDMREYQAFASNNYTVTGDNAEQISQALGGANLREGMQLGFNYDGDGFSNVYATEYNYTNDGGSGVMTTRFGEDGNMSGASFEGVKDGAKVSIAWDGNGVVSETSESGFSHTYNSFISENIGKSVNIGNSTIWAAFSEKHGADAVQAMGLYNGDGSEAAKLAQISSTFSNLYGQSLSEGQSASINIGLQKFLGVSASSSGSETETINKLTAWMMETYEKIDAMEGLSEQQKSERFASELNNLKQGVMENAGSSASEIVKKDMAEKAESWAEKGQNEIKAAQESNEKANEQLIHSQFNPGVNWQKF